MSREKRAIKLIITSLSKMDTKNQSFKDIKLTTKDQKAKTWNKNQTLKSTIYKKKNQTRNKKYEIYF